MFALQVMQGLKGTGVAILRAKRFHGMYKIQAVEKVGQGGIVEKVCYMRCACECSWA